MGVAPSNRQRHGGKPRQRNGSVMTPARLVLWRFQWNSVVLAGVRETPGTNGRASALIEDHLNGATDLGKTLIGHPDLLQIDLVVGVNQDVAHPPIARQGT